MDLLQPLDLHCDVKGGSAKYRNFIERLRVVFTGATLFIPELLKAVRVLPQAQHPPRFIYISLGSGQHIVHFAFNTNNLNLVAFKNRVQGPWYELSLENKLIMPDSVELMEGDYGSLLQMCAVKHDEIKFSKDELHVAISCLAERVLEDIPSDDVMDYKIECAHRLIVCMAYTSEAVRFAIVANQIAPIMGCYGGRRLEEKTTSLFTNWRKISAELIKYGEGSDVYKATRVDPLGVHPHLRTAIQCINSMGMLMPLEE